MASVVALFIVGLLAAEPAGVDPPTFFAGNDELRGYLIEAAENSPVLQQRYAEWRAALARIPQATALDDPEVSYTQFIQSDEARFGIAVMQAFPWFGTLRKRGDMAAREADAALARLYATRNRIFQEVKEAYFDYAFLGQSIETTEAQAAVLTDMEQNVGTRYSVGLASEADLLRVQIEQSQLEDRYNALLQQRPVRAAALTVALGREVDIEVPWPQEADLPPAPPPAPVVLARLRLASPILEEMDRLIEGQEEAVALARLAGYPRFTVGLEYLDMKSPDSMPPEWPYMTGVDLGRGILGRDAGMIRDAQSGAISSILADELMPGMDSMKDDIMLTVGLSVPIWRAKVRAGIAEAKALQDAAVAEKRSRTLNLDLEARAAVFEMKDAQRRYNLYTDVLIPRARQTFDSLQSKYALGEPSATFLDVLASVQVVLEYELEQLRARRDLQIGAARLERIMGGPWSEEEAEESVPLETPPVDPERLTPVPLPPLPPLLLPGETEPGAEIEETEPTPDPTSEDTEIDTDAEESGE